ncbi:MAG: hypothetical protein AB7H92_17645 [Microbacteriaceae bacterium]
MVDYLRRLLHGFPNDPHYAREKSGALVGAALRLHHRLMEPATSCLAVVVEQGSDEDGEYTVERSCALPARHAGEHDARRGERSLLLEGVDELDERVTVLTRRLRWSLVSGDDELLDEVASELVDLGGAVRARLERYRAEVAGA